MPCDLAVCPSRVILSWCVLHYEGGTKMHHTSDIASVAAEARRVFHGAHNDSCASSGRSESCAVFRQSSSEWKQEGATSSDGSEAS